MLASQSKAWQDHFSFETCMLTCAVTEELSEEDGEEETSEAEDTT